MEKITLAFKDITIKDKPLIDNFFSKFRPYCDFSFANLYNWRPNGKRSKIDLLNNNLIIRAADLVTHEYEVSILGANEIVKTIDTLMSQFGTLSLVPEEVINSYPLISEKYMITEDINNNDYIVSTKKLSTLEGRVYMPKRSQIYKFQKSYQYEVVVNKGEVPSTIAMHILNLYRKWAKHKSLKLNPKPDELKAIELLLNNSHLHQLLTILIFSEGKLIGFSLNELVQMKYALCSFAKNDYDYKGSSEMLLHITAGVLLKMGYIYVSYEQDMGLLNLRHEKLSWDPDHLLKKYIISSIE